MTVPPTDGVAFTESVGGVEGVPMMIPTGPLLPPPLPPVGPGPGSLRFADPPLLVVATSKSQPANNNSEQTPPRSARWTDGIYPDSPEFENSQHDRVKGYTATPDRAPVRLVNCVTKPGSSRACAIQGRGRRALFNLFVSLSADAFRPSYELVDLAERLAEPRVLRAFAREREIGRRFGTLPIRGSLAMIRAHA
jgi:hypothetical protein